MKKNCPNSLCACPDFLIRDGTFWRQEDSKLIQRFRCKTCGTRFSNATFTATYRQNKLKGGIHNIQIDDLITKENSKLKPLSVSLAVDEDHRLILGAEVSQSWPLKSTDPAKTNTLRDSQDCFKKYHR